MVPEVSAGLFLIFFEGSIEYGLESGNGDSFFAGRGHGINWGLMGSTWSVLRGAYVGTRPRWQVPWDGHISAPVAECGNRIPPDGRVIDVVLTYTVGSRK